MDLPKRKPNRLPEFDYSSPGACFITICTKDKKCIFWDTTISTVVQQFKGFVTKQIGQTVWQKLFYDHVVRNEKDYLQIWEYIEGNPAKWQEDCFYIE